MKQHTAVTQKKNLTRFRENDIRWKSQLNTDDMSDRLLSNAMSWNIIHSKKLHNDWIAHTLHSSSSPVSVFMALCMLSRSARGKSRKGPILDGPWCVGGTGFKTELTGEPGDVPRSPCVSPASALRRAHLAGGWSSESSRLCATLPVRMQGAGLIHCKFILIGRFTIKAMHKRDRDLF